MAKPEFEKVWMQFCLAQKLPQYVALKDGDNELLINTHNLTAVKMLLYTVKKRSDFQLKEFLHIEKNEITKAGVGYANQLIVSLYKKDLSAKA